MPLSDRFELERPLGQGTFGTTHLARERATGRAVAIKRLPLVGLPEWKPVELFEREARVLRSLDHPGVPAFIDAFEDDDPAGGHDFYIVSEYVEGPTLQAEIVRGRRWSAAEARALLRSLLETLDYLHSLSPRVIHRDIKPANVVLRGGARPVLVDFGSVRDLAAQQAEGSPTIAGTAGYMAPEQAYGIADVRSDLHGLAATLAHALTHVHPSGLPRQGLRPRLHDLAGIDAGPVAILERMLEPEPERRYDSAAAVLRALDGEPPSTALARADAPPPALERRPPVSLATALARLDAAPRTITPELGRLLDAREPEGASRAGLSIMLFFGLMLAAILAGLAKLQPLMVLAAVAAVGSLFVVPALAQGTARRVYAGGRLVQGEIRSATPSDGALHVTYAFRHDGREVVGTLDVSDAFLARHVEPSTPVLVFFEPQRPDSNVGVLLDELPPLPERDP